MDTSIERVIHDKRALNILLKAGYKDYADIKFITEEELTAFPGMGGVSRARTLMDIDKFRAVLYKDLVDATKDAADKVGVEKVLEAVEALL